MEAAGAATHAGAGVHEGLTVRTCRPVLCLGIEHRRFGLLERGGIERRDLEHGGGGLGHDGLGDDLGRALGCHVLDGDGVVTAVSTATGASGTESPWRRPGARRRWGTSSWSTTCGCAVASSASGAVSAVCGDAPASTLRRIPASASSECPWARAERSTSAIASSREEPDAAVDLGLGRPGGHLHRGAVLMEGGAMT